MSTQVFTAGVTPAVWAERAGTVGATEVRGAAGCRRARSTDCGLPALRFADGAGVETPGAPARVPARTGPVRSAARFAGRFAS